MNNKCTISVDNVISYEFKHNFTYKLLFHIMKYYDNEIHKVKLEQKEIMELYNINRISVRVAIEELLDKGIIIPVSHYKNWYNVNYKLFCEFDNVSNYTIVCECKKCNKVINYINYPNTDFIKQQGWIKYNKKWFCSEDCKYYYQLDCLTNKNK